MPATFAFLDPAGWSLAYVLALLVAAAAVILVVGTFLAREADRLADRTRMGEAIFGAVLLGASTSLSGVVTSVTTAYQDYPQLAASNAVGGIAVQTAFLAVADITYRRANLEHAAASIENLLQGALLCTLLALPLVIATAPPITILGVHPASLLLILGYGLGVKATHTARKTTLWYPRITKETQLDVPTEDSPARTGTLWLRFALFAAVSAVAGYAVAVTGITLVERTGLGATVVGAFVTAVATSLPELVVAVAAVRRGALTLAVGGIIGGNTFDVLLLAASDVAYHGGSIYHALGTGEMLLIALSIMMTGVLLLGLLRRERHGPAGIGFESTLVLGLYVAGVILLALGRP